MLKKAIQTGTLFATIAALFVAGVTYAAAPPKSGLSISPPTFELSANPGDTLRNSLRVDNVVDEPLEVTVSTRNFTALGEEGGVDLSSRDNKYSLASWISVSPSKVTIPARQSQVFDYTIAVPADASPGGRFGSIIFKTSLKPVSGQSGVAVGQEIGTLVFLKIAGEVKEKASVASFETVGAFHDNGPVEFSARVKNEGNVQLRPTGTITISNFFGNKVATIPINEQNVLPDAIRKMNATWKNQWLLGRYTATLSLVYGKDRQTMTASTAFWGFPYKLVGAMLLILGIITALVYPHRTRLKLALKVLFGKQ